MRRPTKNADKTWDACQVDLYPSSMFVAPNVALSMAWLNVALSVDCPQLWIEAHAKTPADLATGPYSSFIAKVFWPALWAACG